MRYLLDTHVLLWYVDGSPELPLSLKDMIEESECWYSIASLWEIAIKQSLGKLNRDIAIREYARICSMAGFQELSIAPAHLDRLKNLPDFHRDPFDRLLIAQAQEEKLTIVTRDKIIPQYPVQTIW